MKFLHTADWQIGRQYSRFAPEDAAALAEARFTSVETIAALACERQVDAVLVAGDVFDAQSVSDRTIRRLFNALEGYSGPWIMIPGNHDSALAESVWTRANRLAAIPANARVLLQPDVLEFPGPGFAILPAPLTQRHTYSDLTEWFDRAATASGLIRIGLAHGSVQGILAEDIDSTNPIAADRVERAALDYLALGDWHGLKQINSRCWYSGTQEQERFRDNGAGQVLEVSIAAPGEAPAVQPLEVTRFKWHQLQASLRVASDVDTLLQKLAEIAEPAVIDIVLSGEIDLASWQSLQRALAEAEARHRSLQCNLAQLRFSPTEDDIAVLRADGYVGDVLAELRDQQQGDYAESARDALAILAGMLLERESGVSL